MTARDMKILIIGGTGQIGHELVRELSGLGEIVAPPRDVLDLTSATSVRDALRGVRPALVVNAAAYTAVDRAESEPELCARINADAPELLAAECASLGSALVHFSTDYVFDGTATRPYVESDDASPLNVYGRTKRAGEEAIVAAGGAHLIFRTSWVYGARGRNFALTMLGLFREHEAALRRRRSDRRANVCSGNRWRRRRRVARSRPNCPTNPGPPRSTGPAAPIT